VSAPRVCCEPHCPRLVVTHGRCAEHRLPAEYGRPWERARRTYLERHPRCERCSAVAVMVHHRDGLGARGAGHQQANLEALCRRCHEAEPTTHSPRGWRPGAPHRQQVST
jgi:5-methylcytosine-specific restriction protein A